ncbi:sushi, von Willebrand factor type A, EGF and pentraxin domain-containing protein 1-like [Rhopilema esculentum]|uniref:sushi, von Willebrand factor type A, EGF and pentraxin domain-containing protein 1-like n=1 Tax=Rhopilema esculentum TaxID=499914 RepID=UPI0031DE7B9E
MEAGNVEACGNSVYKTGCVQPDHPKNGKGVRRLNYKHGDDADYLCNDNFKLKGKRQVCSGLNWSGKVPKCEEIRTCPKKFTDPKLYITAEKYTPGSFGIFRCKDGFELEGDSQASCHRNLTWSGRRTCREYCLISLVGDNFLPHGGLVELKCPGTETVKKRYRCNNGKWQLIKDFGCQPGCVKPSSFFANGKITIKGSVAEIRCKRRFKIYGKSKLTCQNGKWSDEWPNCISNRTCISKFSKPLSTVTKLTRHLNPQTFMCASGYEIKGSAVLLCYHGSFPATLPICEPSSCKSSSTAISFQVLCKSNENVYIAKVTNIDVAEAKLLIIVSLKGSRIGDTNVKILNLVEPEKFGCPTMKRGNHYIFFTRSTLNDVTRVLPIDEDGMQTKQLSFLKYFCGY